ncbi:membrane-associated protein [Halorubrum sp. JWXQ-INN 858]|uniref:DedA family protein n=1 Tax=Halorubrum sp. JWXQ-INN 858 TaxID=2690782 RepID=UPI0013596BDB|nr:VTT domain-containing protein [Halorubrum sp. JWXQ-INN 858]MWV63383.1 membrane-associated protein [Halorubrum sp. JWXQ-INN 858]
MTDALADAGLTALLEFGLPAMFVVFVMKGALIGKPLPTSVLLPGYLLAVSASDRLVAAAVAVAAAGYVCGQLLVYGGARRYGPDVVDSRWLSVSEERLDRANRWFRRYGGVSVFVTNLVPYVGSFVLIPAGIARYPFGRVVVYATVSTVLNYAVIVWVVVGSVDVIAGL